MRFASPYDGGSGMPDEAGLEAQRLVFLELTQGERTISGPRPFPLSHRCDKVCLWGNSTDLSLLINMTEDQIRSLQSTGGDHLASTEVNILGNDMGRIWETVKTIRKTKEHRRIDFVLDNAGFELYCDFVYGTHASTDLLLTSFADER